MDLSGLVESFDEASAFAAGRDIQRIPVDEVRRFTGGSATGLVRLAVMWELNRCRNDWSYRRGLESRTIRNLWYSVVKPFLSRTEDPADIVKPKWGRYRSQTLSAVLSEMVLEGLCRYSEFKIEDRTRPKKRPWEKFKTGRFDEVILFIEKDSSFPHIEKLADLLGFTVECGKGQQATAAIEDMIEYLDEDKSYLVFTLTDYDYYGFLIAQSLEERVTTLGVDAEFIRVGVDIEQVPRDRREVAKFRLPLSSKNEKEWAEWYAIDGIYGLEIEALTPQELRGIIADAVYEHCDPEALYEYLKKRALESVADDVARQLADEDDGVIEIRGKIRELEKQLAEIRDELIGELEPVADELLTDNLEDIDDRPEFPFDWLREKMVSGETWLSPGHYTSPGGIAERLADMVRNRRDPV